MGECCDYVPPPFEPSNPPRITPPAPGSTTLVRDLGARSPRTTREETDARGAMRRGLQEYLAQAEKDVAGARVRFQEVFEEWAESEDDNVRYPSAAVLLADDEVVYDAHAFTPQVSSDDRLPDGRYIVKVSEATTDFIIECHSSSPGEPLGVAMLLEETLNPVDFMYGFVLALPHYFGERASFQVLSAGLPDNEATARHGLRPLRMKVSGRISVVRPRALPTFQPKLQITVEDPTADPNVTIPIGG